MVWPRKCVSAFSHKLRSTETRIEFFGDFGLASGHFFQFQSDIENSIKWTKIVFVIPLKFEHNLSHSYRCGVLSGKKAFHCDDGLIYLLLKNGFCLLICGDRFKFWLNEFINSIIEKGEHQKKFTNEIYSEIELKPIELYCMLVVMYTYGELKAPKYMSNRKY